MSFSNDRQEDDELKVKFGDAVRYRRRELGISQDELAARSGLNRSYITEVETGKRNVALVNIGRLAEALELPIAGLFHTVEHSDAKTRSFGKPEVGD